MNKNEILVVLGTAHRRRLAGKQSPDGSLLECVYSREVASGVKMKLEAYGYRVVIDYTPLDLPKTMQTPYEWLETQRELGMRVNFVNELCRQYGAKCVLYVSIHVDASGKDGQWHGAHGWSVRVSPKASAQSKLLAGCLFDAAEAHGLCTRRQLANQKYWVQSLEVLNDTDCPAVLTENLFQDNRKDVAFLLSDEGRHTIERLHVEGIIRYIEAL